DAFALDLMVDLSSDAEVFLDIGAYTGVFTVAVLAANPRVRAHAFEIMPAVVAGLQKKLDRNALTHRVTVHPAGVGSPDPWRRVPRGDAGSALPSCASADMDFDSDAEVRFTSLDALLPEVLEDIPDPAEDAGQSRPRVTLKIDVEGGENDVLAH